MDCKKDNKRLKRSAHQILATLKPVIRLSANKISIALIINKKRPKVIMVTGSVRITKMGLTKKFRRLNTRATIRAVV